MDDEMKARFDALDAAIEEHGHLTARIVDLVNARIDGLETRLSRHDTQLEAIVTRLEEQDAGHDRLMGKMDRLAVRIDQLSVLASAGEAAMTSLDAPSRRVAKLEAAQRGGNE